ncbi:GNAT family N-acetyltransferase [Thermoactinomyces mirandus]|uniref:GNAT family N-acetyltransferase n=1 Tax=Thermoactinomyces mirandus TaxID=2756294 RepID=A0A7W1XT26_9BACL|nr:GNAT family N-acetyltransferase [Thermoactinomyces mirandus]MBA4602651.1 GNAT family N-acetyltransferase [Thermoactinomyces mirandus]
MNSEVTIRKAVENDAEQIIQHTKKVLKENPDVFATTLEEYNMSVKEEKKWIKLVKKQGLLIVAEVNGTIIGMLDFELSPRKKFCHQGSFGMSIQEAFTNKGIGGLLIKTLLAWAEKDNRVEKVSLEVFSNNRRAIHVYKKYGFTEEGIRKKHVKSGPGEYLDVILMSRFV